MTVDIIPYNPSRQARPTAAAARRTGAVGIAVIGAGYWGPNIVRNGLALSATDLKWVCDRDLGRAHGVVGAQSAIGVTPDIDEVLDDDAVEAVAIATPPATHAELALRCIEAGRHVLVEKPLADSYEAGWSVVEAAEERGVVLHCDHTFCYTPAVQKIRELVARGAIGTPLYYDSVRVNLGLVQQEVDVFWDLAPHDISILDFVLGAGRELSTVTAEGADPLGVGHACVGYLSLHFDDGLQAHCHLNWLSPTKIRTTILGGSEKMIVWNDLLPAQRVSVFESGVDLAETDLSLGEQRRRRVSYRTGSMVVPPLPEREALLAVLEDWAAAIRTGRPPMTDGSAGLRVLRVLEAAQVSLRHGAAPVPVTPDGGGAMTEVKEELRRVDAPKAASERPTASRPLLSIVIPAHNEAGVVGVTLQRIARLAATEPELAGRIEAIVVSDGSSDTTFEEACDVLRRRVGGAVLELSRNVGSHAALRWALRYARGDFVAVMAADGQDPPEVLPAMLRRFGPPVEVVWGRRTSRHDPVHVRLTAAAFYRVFRLLTGIAYPRSGIDYFVARRRVIETLLKGSSRNTSLIFSIYSLGFRQAFVDYDRGARTGGQSKFNLRKRAKVAIDMLSACSAAPIRVAALAGIVACLAGVGLGGASLVRAAVESTPAPGWAAVMVLGSVAGGAMFVAIALLAEYVWRILDEVRGSPPLVEVRHERVVSAAEVARSDR